MTDSAPPPEERVPGQTPEQKQTEHQNTHVVLLYTERFKRIIAAILLALMAILVSIATVELIVGMAGWFLPGKWFSAANFVLTEDELLKAFGVFLTVLIALELVETVEVYFRRHAVHVEIVLLVALIALARKLILLDLHDYSAMTLIGLASIIVALGAAYFLIRRAGPPD